MLKALKVKQAIEQPARTIHSFRNLAYSQAFLKLQNALAALRPDSDTRAAEAVWPLIHTCYEHGTINAHETEEVTFKVRGSDMSVPLDRTLLYHASQAPGSIITALLY